MNRRKFLLSSAVAAAGMAVAGKSEIMAFSREKSFNGQVLIPPGLKAGSRVGLVSPAGSVSEKQVLESEANLKNLGLIPVRGKHILEKFGYLAGGDKERAEDINSMFADETIQGLWCTRGGYGCSRMLDYIDFDLVAKNPKLLIGYSDITALNYALFAKAGLISFSGPVGISTFDELSVSSVRQLLFSENKAEGYVIKGGTGTADEYKPMIINPGKAAGRLIGGNLSVLVSLTGTPYEPDYEDAVLFIEEVSEDPYRIDRMLTQLLLAGRLKKLKGIAAGIFTKCVSNEEKSGLSGSFSFREVLTDRLKHLGIPAYYGFGFGHVSNKYTIPFGIRAELDAGEGTLTILENTVK
ncbi:MAG: LD-carboxypeptidase [Ignavibacteriaceae bacterium]|nr:LD-carboxypeptidase [Ignavibacteriaceae bacterium]NUM71493.1 LD-carboxypeptidase [Ignavibacteriaceae bacterium]